MNCLFSFKVERFFSTQRVEQNNSNGFFCGFIFNLWLTCGSELSEQPIFLTAKKISRNTRMEMINEMNLNRNAFYFELTSRIIARSPNKYIFNFCVCLFLMRHFGIWSRNLRWLMKSDKRWWTGHVFITWMVNKFFIFFYAFGQLLQCSIFFSIGFKRTVAPITQISTSILCWSVNNKVKWHRLSAVSIKFDRIPFGMKITN